MKTIPNSLLLLFTVAVGSAIAANTFAAGEQQEGPALSQQELAALEQFLSLSDEQLDRIQAAIARVRAMSPEERRACAEEIARFRDLPAPERAQIREGWGWQSARDRDDWRAMMQSLSMQERWAIQEQMHALDPADRSAFRQEVLEEWRRKP